MQTNKLVVNYWQQRFSHISAVHQVRGLGSNNTRFNYHLIQHKMPSPSQEYDSCVIFVRHVRCVRAFDY